MRSRTFPVLLALLLLPVVAVGQAVSITSKAVYAPYTFADFEASGPDNWAYDWEFPEGVDFRLLDDVGRKAIVIAPPGTYIARLTAVGPSGNDKVPFAIKKAVKSFVIGDAPEPGPDPQPDDGKVPKAKKLYVYIWFDPATRTAAQAAVINDTSWRQAIMAKHQYRIESVNDGEDERMNVKPFLDKVGQLPTVTVHDAATGKVLNAFSLPSTAEILKTEILKSEAK